MQILNQYQDFLENQGPFADSTESNMYVAPLYEWRDAMGGGAKALQTIARRILGQVCSASAGERNWSMYSYVHNKGHNCLKHIRAKDLVYIYTNSRLLRHRRDPKPAQWYRLNKVHSDDDLDGEDDNDVDLDQNDKGDIVDDYDIDLENHDSDDDDDDDDYDGDENLGVFDFDEGDIVRHNEARHEDHDGSIGRPSCASLFGGQGPRPHHNVVVEGIENVRNEVDSSQPQSDSLSFGQANEGDDAVRANEAVNVQNEQRRTEIHLESTDASLESNHPMEIETPNVVEATTAPVDTIHGSASTSGLNLHSGPQCRHVT